MAFLALHICRETLHDILTLFAINPILCVKSCRNTQKLRQRISGCAVSSAGVAKLYPIALPVAVAVMLASVDLLRDRGEDAICVDVQGLSAKRWIPLV